VRADHPIAAGTSKYYYEITVLDSDVPNP